jgi:hypothetical protein
MSLVLNVEILGEYKKLTQATKGAESQLGKLNKTTSSISKSMKGALGAIGVGFTLNKVVDGIKGAITASSDLSEAVNAINVSYGEQAKEIERLGEVAAQGLGLSRVELYGIATQFSSFSKTIAGDGGDAVAVFNDLSTRGADFASVFNLDVNTALAKFQSGLAGQSEPLRAFGIDLSAATVEAYALDNGIIKSGETMTEQQKILARYGALMEQTSMVQGDFANTSDGLANQQRILNAEFENAKAEVGQALIPVMTELLGVVMQHIPEIKALAAGFVDVAKWVAESVLVAIEYKDILIPLAGLIGGIVAVTKTWAIAQGAVSLALSHPALLGAAAIILLIAGAYKTLSRDADQAAQAVRELNAAKQQTESTGGYTLPPGQTDYAPYSYTPPTVPTYSAPSYEGIAGGGSNVTSSSPIIINNNITTTSNASASEIVSSLQRYQQQTGISRILLK